MKKYTLRFTFHDIIGLIFVASIVFIGILSGEKAGQLLFSISLALIMFFLITKRKLKFKKSPIIIRLYFLLCCMSIISLFYSKNTQFTFDVLWKVFSAFSIMIFIDFYATNLEKIFKLMYFFLLSTLILSVYNIVNYQPTIFRELPYGGVNPVALLMFLSIIIALLLAHIHKKYVIFLIPIYLYHLFLTQSQKSILSLVIALLFYSILNLLFINNKSTYRNILISILIIIVGYYFLLEFDILSGASTRTFATIEALITNEAVEGAAGGAAGEGLRSVLKISGWDYFSQKPFFGHGLNNFRELFGRDTGLYTYSHHTPIELIVGMGFLAAIIYYGIYYILLKNNFIYLRIYRNSLHSLIISSIIAILIIGLYMQTYFDAAIHFYLMLLFVYNRIRKNKFLYEK